MIIILQPHITSHSADYRQLMDYLTNRPNIQTRVHQEVGTQQTLTEIYLIGDTASLDQAEVEHQPGVERVVRISEDYRILGRHHDDRRPTGFDYNGVLFSQDSLNVFAGLCAVDIPEHVEQMMKALRDHGNRAGTCGWCALSRDRSDARAVESHEPAWETADCEGE